VRQSHIIYRQGRGFMQRFIRYWALSEQINQKLRWHARAEALGQILARERLVREEWGGRWCGHQRLVKYQYPHCAICKNAQF
jgi:hypothetical protein